MPRNPFSLRFLVVLVVLLGVAALTIPEPQPAVQAVAEAVERGKSAEMNTPPSRPAERLDRSALSNRTLPPLSPTLFGNVVAVPPVQAVTLAPPPPPIPVAPPLPYAYLGQYRDADGLIAFYLRRDDKLIVAKPGTQLDDRYQLEAEIRNGLTFTFLPLKEAQVIPIGNPSQ